MIRAPTYCVMPSRHIPRTLAALLLALGVLSGRPDRACAQGGGPSAVYATRAGLDSLANRYELAAQSPAYSEELRDEARQRAADFRGRLQAGDFKVGDRIYLVVDQEPTLTDTFTVETGPIVTLPLIGRVPLDGVLRSEVEGHLAQAVGGILRNPMVRAETLVRLSVTGQVGRPGFYAVSTDLPLTDVLVIAGQVTGLADLSKIRVQRGGRVLWDAAALGPRILEGRTLNELGVLAGDQIEVGEQARSLGSFESGVRTILLITTLPLTIAGLIALFS